MGKYIDTGKWYDYQREITRQGTFPLDRSSMFDSLSDAIIYAKGGLSGNDSRQLQGTSYIGQIITVYDGGVSTYIIDENRNLSSFAFGGNLQNERWDEAWSIVSALSGKHMLSDSVALSNEENMLCLIKDNSERVWIDNRIDTNPVISGYEDLSIIKLPLSDYELCVIGETLSNNTLYVTDSDYIEAYGEQLCNLTMSDVEGEQYFGIAVTKPYVDIKLSSLSSQAEMLKQKLSSTIPLLSVVEKDDVTHQEMREAMSALYVAISNIVYS